MRGVIKIGAHYGEGYCGYVKAGVKNFIFIEPVKTNYDILVRELPKSDNIKTFNMALGNRTGTVKMFIEESNKGQSCSIMRPTNHLIEYPDIQFNIEEYVLIDRLDNIKYDRNLYDELHIKAQGYEFEVLKGATDSLKYINMITMQVYRVELFEGCPLVEEIIDYLHDFCLVEINWRCKSWGVAEFKRNIIGEIENPFEDDTLQEGKVYGVFEEGETFK
jgi:FkbM family methyltransferase